MTTPKVQYSYADGSGNTIRPTRTTYPDGRELNFDYGSAGSQADMLGRVSSLIDDDKRHTARTFQGQFSSNS